MAPNKRGGPQGSVLTDDEIAARGRGTSEEEGTDSYDGSPAAEIRVFFTGLMFLTRLPVPPGTDHHPRYLLRSTAYFPLIGAAVGLWGAVFFTAGAALWPRPIAAGVSTLATVWLTDGFGGGWGRAQILRIMRDSRVGTYALVGVAILLHIKMTAMQSLPDAASVIIVAHCVSRWPSLPLLTFCEYIEDDEHAKAGMYNVMARCQPLLTWPRFLLGTLVSLAVPALVLGAHGTLVVWATTLVITTSSIYYCRAIIQGVVGDYIGGTIVITEIAIYLALSADWAALAAEDGWRPILVLLAALVVPVVWGRRIVDFSC